ncbi:hypothetical protein [Rubinisphaera brasiliensis]|uniref:Uncharacterized protein n=1 Tax=Rubinisphaera brasiliensis (strain ATCC 49424 / DSM 5305 / JCM 21570 / IAM 15109 / NBRC 103401 / IFAM 1448) TaxID=756272 RepID=F0SNL7_RUBBR|nr:hypothetical protein [Rubinisphaera brasiliensis]ADY57851.1 hypothetical protein Plabr_0222 [Rubinisphaera brasiliensis DSM 5305]
MSVSLNNVPDAVYKAPHTAAYVDDFFGLEDTTWNTVDDDSGATVAHDADGVNGVVLLTTGATDNNEAYLYTNEIFKIANNRTICVDVRLSYSESATDDANVIVGLVNGVAANLLQDNGAGPKATFDGACIYKVDGETRWRVRSSNGTTATTHETTVTAGGGYQLLRIMIVGVDSATAKVTYLFDADGGQNPSQAKEYNVIDRIPPITHDLALSGLDEELALVVGVKAGSASSEVVSVDYTVWDQTR